MSQSLSVQASNPYLRGDMEAFHIICDWQGDVDMAVSKALAATYKAARTSAPFPDRIRGRIVKIETIPGYLGDKATFLPFGTYDLTLLDPYGYDVLDGNGAARSITVAEIVAFSTPLAVDSDLTFTIATVATTDQIAGRGAFTGAATGWTLGAGWAYGTNNIAKTAGAGTAADDTFAATAGRIYDVTYTIAGWATAANRGLKCTCGGVDGTTRTADGTYTDTITATGTGGVLFTPTGTDAANVACTLDSVTVKLSTPRGRAIIWIAAP